MCYFMFYYLYINLSVIIYFSLKSVSIVIIKYVKLLRFKCCGFGRTNGNPTVLPITKKLTWIEKMKGKTKSKNVDPLKSIMKRDSSRRKQRFKRIYAVHFHKLKRKKRKLTQELSVIKEESEDVPLAPPKRKFSEFMDNLENLANQYVDKLPVNGQVQSSAKYVDHLNSTDKYAEITVDNEVGDPITPEPVRKVNFAAFMDQMNN